MKWILPAPYVAGNNISVVEIICRSCQRIQIPFRRIILIIDQLHIVFVDQIFVPLLHKSNDDPDICDPRLLKLPDDTLDQRLPAHFQQSLGLLRIDRHHPHTCACRQDHRLLRSPLIK